VSPSKTDVSSLVEVSIGWVEGRMHARLHGRLQGRAGACLPGLIANRR
jgi:hypothetical protein